MSALRRPITRAAALAAVPFLLGACEWFTDFKQQPKVEPWESEFQSDTIALLRGDTIAYRGNPQHSVPIYGNRVPGYVVSYAALPGTIDSMAALPNPTPANEASLENGRKYYLINCAVCHGDDGSGNGPVTKYGMPGISIINDVTKGRTDGYIYGMIRNGRGLMPSYNRIEDLDRWDVVNYVRGLQGGLAVQVPKEPLAAPGVNGRAVPGYTQTAPTRPSPYFRDTRSPLPGHAPAPGSSGSTGGTGPVEQTNPTARPTEGHQ